MRTLREGELTVNLPTPTISSSIDLEAAGRAIWCPPGRLAVEMDPPRSMQGGVHLPEHVGARLRADCGTVVSAHPEMDVQPGDRVLVRPYHGLWIEPFRSEQPAIDELEKVQSPIRAGRDKVLVVVDRAERWTDLEIAKGRDSELISTGRVLDANGSDWPCRGARVVFSNYHPLSRHVGVDRIDDGVVSVPLDHIYAVLGSSAYEAHQVRFYGAVTPWRDSILMVWRQRCQAKEQFSNQAIERGRWQANRQIGETESGATERQGRLEDNEQRIRTDRCSDGGWEPVAPWVLIERDLTPFHGIHLPEVAAARLRHRAMVLQCGSGRIPPGSEVLMEADPNHAISFDLGDMHRCHQIVHERAIWGILE